LQAARAVGFLRNAKIGELDLTRLAQENVRRRHVTVNDAGGLAVLVGRVREVQRKGERGAHIRGELRAEGLPMLAKVGQHASKVGTLDQL